MLTVSLDPSCDPDGSGMPLRTCCPWLTFFCSEDLQRYRPERSRSGAENQLGLDRGSPGDLDHKIHDSKWAMAETPVYFLARGASVASCHEARLLWEEAAKGPATALTTGSFRHGSQEMIRLGVSIGLWLQSFVMREEDLQLAADLRQAGASVLLVGSDLAPVTADLLLDLPATPPGWQFLTDIIPLQLAAEFVARHGGEDCDAFRFCPYVIEEEGGLVGGYTGR
jgi:fructoselysine-6-P-deglycase FrlB-like protein